MIKRALVLLVLCIAGLASAEEPETRVMSLITQDKNGLYMFMVIATPSEMKAGAKQFGVEKPWESKSSRYPRELFDELWLEAKNLGLSEFISKSVPGVVQDVGAARNYLISIGNGPGGDTYSVPKCSASPAIVSFVLRLTNDMLPSGSPGLLEPCPPASKPNDG